MKGLYFYTFINTDFKEIRKLFLFFLYILMIILFLILLFLKLNSNIIIERDYIIEIIQNINQDMKTIEIKLEILKHKFEIFNNDHENILKRIWKNFLNSLQTKNNIIIYNYPHFPFKNSTEICPNQIKNILDETALLEFKNKALKGVITDIESIIKDLENTEIY